MSMLSRMKKSSHRRSGDGDSLLRGVIDASFDPMLAITSSDKKICMANDAAIKDFGYKYSELIGKDVSLIFASKDDANRYMRASVDGVQEVVCCRKDATKFPATLGVREINECGQSYHSLYLRDLHETITVNVNQETKNYCKHRSVIDKRKEHEDSEVSIGHT